MRFALRKLKNLCSLNINTIRFNFKYFKFLIALKFPVLVSSNVLLSRLDGNISIKEPLYFGKVKIGFGDVGIFDRKLSRSIWEVKGLVDFRGSANIGHGSKIAVGQNGKLVLGNNFTISAQSSIVAFKNISIGDDCLISWDVLIMDTDFHKINDLNNTIINSPKPILLGDQIWVGCRCLILKGSEIPSKCVIAAGTTINNKLTGENQVFAGSPAQVSRTGIFWTM